MADLNTAVFSLITILLCPFHDMNIHSRLNIHTRYYVNQLELQNFACKVHFTYFTCKLKMFPYFHVYSEGTKYPLFIFLFTQHLIKVYTLSHLLYGGRLITY